MAFALRAVGFAAVLGSVAGARVKRTNGRNLEAKFIGKVPVLNYHKAHRGKRSTSEAEDWVVVMDEKTADADIANLCAHAPGPCKMVGHPDAGGVAFLEVRGTEDALEAMMSHDAKSLVQFIEPDPLEKILDLDVAELASERGPSATSTPVWSVRRVGGDTSTTKGKGIHIYVVDSGVRTTHQDFGGRAVPTLDMTQGDESSGGKECNGDTSCATDSIGHGTHCAGSAGGSTFGVAPQSIVHAMKISFDGLSTWSRTIAAFDFVAAKGQRPSVATASVGGDGTSAAMRTSIDRLTAQGVIVLTSAGNSGNDACGYTPANVPNCMSVGALTGIDSVAGFSNWGACVDIWAPGQSIISASHSSNTGSTSKAGTSMACPHVAGGAAVLLEENPRLTPAALRQELANRALNDYIPNLRSPEDTNKLLFVGTGTPPGSGDLEPCRRRRRLLCNA